MPMSTPRRSALRRGAFAYWSDSDTGCRGTGPVILGPGLSAARCRLRRCRGRFGRFDGRGGSRFAGRQRGPRTSVPDHALGLDNPGIGLVLTAKSGYRLLAAVRLVHFDVEAVLS